MDDSDQDFVDLCSKLLKRVRKKPGGSRPPRKAEHQPSSQARDAGKRREADAEPSAAAAAARPRGLEAKDKVLHRLQQFKRASPQKMVHKDKSQPTNPTPAPPLTQRRDTPHSFSAGLRPEPQDSDEALALRLQQELDREAAETQVVDLEDRGLFFCQICHRDLSHMTPEGRTQHLNRCLDESEESAPAPPPPPSGVPDCPICGRKFKSQKSRSAHLKRCSSEMGVAPAVLLQALRRQTEETQNVPADSTLAQTGGTKRKGPSKPGLPAKKKPRKKTPPLDEDTMVALALSSLLEQEQRGKRESEAKAQTNTAASHFSTTSALKWRTDTGKGRGKRKKGAVPRPPPLLLVQDAEAAVTRLQVRVSALLLRSRAPSPPTPTRCPSSLPGRSGAAVLWQKTTLPPDGDSTRPSDFYTPELREFIAPWESATTDAATSSTTNKPQSSVQPVSEGTPGTGTVASILPSASSSQTPPSTSRALLMDLMELAEDGVTLTQCGHTASGPDEDGSAGRIPNIRLSGFVPEESEEQADLCVSGFLPEPTHTEDARCRARRTTAAQPGADEERGSRRSAALSSLASALSGMVNNPQLSDLQLQVDSGEVYFAHSFMLYARCPLLAEMAHESGFGVQEEGRPAAQRVLMNDVPGRAVLALLQYLYTARCSVPASLRPHVLELASRFDLQELQSLCELPHQDPVTRGDEEDDGNQEEDVNNRTHQALAELLRSMWDEEDEDGEGTETGGGRDEGRELEDDQQAVVLLADREIVNEEELEEIYEFAATQRKREEEKDSTEEEKVDEEEVFTEPKRSPSGLGVNKPQPNSQPEPDPGLDRSYSLLFSDCWGVYEEEDPSSLPSTSAPAKTHPPPQCQQRQSPHQPSSEPSLLQSSASVVDDLSLSPPPNASDLPIPGQSPGQDDLALKRERPGPRSVCEKKEPELIVLSDSSEEMEVVVGPRGPSPHSPRAVQNLQGYTQIKPQPVPKPNEPTLPNTQSSSFELGPDDPSAAPVQSHPGPWCDQNPEDCSPEVSWLIPSTPVQPGRSTATSCTQTKSSVCRTQLFPRGDTSSPSVFCSPALPSATCNSPARVSAFYVPKSKPDETSSSSSDLDRRSKRPGRCGASRDRGAGALPPCRPKLSSSTSSKQDTPLHGPARPYSSTPLHTELHKVPDVLATSLLDESWTSHGRDTAPSESPRETGLGSFPLSPLSDPTPPPSSSSYRGLQGSQRLGEASRQSRRSVESSSHNSAGSELKGRGEGEMGCENKDTGDEGEQEEAEDGEAEVAESSFQQSFMDEPPIAFNDSWGFDAVDFEANPGCFSLRLEDSGASSQQGERSLGRREAAGPASSSTDRHPSPRSRLGSVAACSPPKAHSSRPSTGVRADTGLSFTPSPPDPTKQTTPEFINGLLDSKIWDSWEEDEEVEALPLSQRVNPSAQLKTPASAQIKRRHTLVPITPLPHYSDMDTPELKNKLNRFGVRSLPKRQMILKLKQIHQYTHQLVSSEEEEEAPSASRAVQTQHPTTTSEVPANRPVSCTQRVKFKEPSAAIIAPPKADREEEEEQLSASQGSNTSSSAASEQRSNPELHLSSDSDSDGGVSASQSANRLQDRLRAVRSFILSDSELYGQILQYRPLVLAQLQERLKATGIRLGAAKLVDYLDSQCITFTTAKPGHSAAGRRRGKRTGRGAKAAGRGRAGTALI
ncbi:structure-specific endonuclease subunit SLX4-like [Lycodopsis pacificus]